MDKTEKIKSLCEEKQIRMIDFKMTDIDGRWRHITIPVERFGENTPFDQYPKNISLRAIEYMKEKGIADQMIIGPEFEFYLFDKARFEVSPAQCGYRIDTKQADWNHSL